MSGTMKAVALTTERHATHGSFAEVAQTTSRLVDVIKTTTSYPLLNETQKMALKEIFHKIGRITAGNPNHADHWDDVGGYAELGSRACVLPAEAPRLPARRKAKRAKAAKKQVRVRPAKKAAKVARRAKAPKARNVSRRARAARPIRVRRPARVAAPAPAVSQQGVA